MTTKDYLDEYAELWEVQHKGSEDTVERNYRKLEELAKELEAGIRKEVVEYILENLLKKARETDYADRTEYDVAYDFIRGMTFNN